jgi:hypothetical protein
MARRTTLQLKADLERSFRSPEIAEGTDYTSKFAAPTVANTYRSLEEISNREDAKYRSSQTLLLEL